MWPLRPPYALYSPWPLYALGIRLKDACKRRSKSAAFTKPGDGPDPTRSNCVNLTNAGVVFAFHDASVGWAVRRVAFPDVRARPRQRWIGGVILAPALRNVWSEHLLAVNAGATTHRGSGQCGARSLGGGEPSAPGAGCIDRHGMALQRLVTPCGRSQKLKSRRF